MLRAKSTLIRLRRQISPLHPLLRSMRQYNRQRQVNIVKPEQYTRAVENARKCCARSRLRRPNQKRASFSEVIPSGIWRVWRDTPSPRGEEIFIEVRLTAQKGRDRGAILTARVELDGNRRGRNIHC